MLRIAMHNKNMKFYIENKELSQVVSLIKTVAEKDTKVVLLLGAKEQGDNVLCGVCVTTVREQIQYKLSVKKPQGWEGKGVQVSVSASKFTAICDAVLSYNEDVFIEPDNTVLMIGNGKVNTPVEIESEIPQEITQSTLFYRFKVVGKELASVLKKGCAFARASQGNVNTDNAILQLDPDAGEIRGYSTDGYTLGKGKAKAEFTKDAGDNAKLAEYLKAMEEALAAYCEKSGQNKNAFNVLIPSLSVKHLQQIVEGQSAVFLSVDERHLLVQLGEKLVYTIVQGGAVGFPAEQVDAMGAMASDTLIGIDSAVLSKGIDFINKVNAISGNADKIPVSIETTDGSLSASSGAAGQIKSAIKALAIQGSEANFAVAGKYLTAALNSLNKGNVVLGVSSKFVTLFNGTVDAVDDSNFVIIGLVRTGAMPQPQSDEESDEAEKQE